MPTTVCYRRSACRLSLVEGFVGEVMPEESRGSDSFRAAVLLLLGPVFENNLDRLAGITRYPPAFIARVARRLTDNGVWRGRDTVAGWCQSADTGSFMADIRVAKGDAYRRRSADGQFEWAAVGEWWKQYDYIPTGRQAEVAASYRDVPPIREPDEECGFDQLEVEEETTTVSAGRVFVLDDASDGVRVDGVAAGGRQIERELVPAACAAQWFKPSELFPHAVWLG